MKQKIHDIVDTEGNLYRVEPLDDNALPESHLTLLNIIETEESLSIEVEYQRYEADVLEADSVGTVCTCVTVYEIEAIRGPYAPDKKAKKPKK